MLNRIIKEYITTVLGLAIIAFGVYIGINSREDFINLNWKQIALILLPIVVGVTLVLSPDKFLQEFWSGINFFKRKQNRE